MKTFFEQSFQDWRAATGGTLAYWQALCAERWREIKAGAHFHNGVACIDERSCKRYQPRPQAFES
jgi:hypothetical protein